MGGRLGQPAFPPGAPRVFDFWLADCVYSRTPLPAQQVYIAWNMHEPHPGQYEWTGFADIERWLRLIQARAAHACSCCSCYFNAACCKEQYTARDTCLHPSVSIACSAL